MLTRTFALDDLTVRSEGDGRSVVAYAAVFDTPAEIKDHDGHYIETIDRSAFNRTISQHEPSYFRALFNHGMSLHGTPSERFSMPWGVPTELTADTRGLLTVTRAARTDLGDEVLELAKAGALKGFSFSARSISAERTDTGDLPAVHRTEFALSEFGPAVFPAYQDAELIGVRHSPPDTQPDPDPGSSDGSSDRDTDPRLHSVTQRLQSQVAARLTLTRNHK